ncbi:MAG TPA: branched-chain amino acid ABC transporter permease [Thermomicrobiales bacterium]|nr:branched-chain amino acid ABC transporter permease [Thermomicrobiales bacterium]
MGASEFAQQLVNALGLGSVYALIAVGLAMVFGILRLINFAHGEVLMLGGYAAVFFVLAGWPFPIAAALTVVATVLIGVLMERVAYRPVRGAPDVALLLTSLGVSIALQNAALLVFGTQPKPFPPQPALAQQIPLAGGVQVSGVNLVTILAALVLMVLLTLFVTRTALGTQMRAVAENAMAARLMGISVNTVIVSAFVVGSALAGVAALLYGARVGRVEYGMGFIPVLKAFVATVIGGFGSIPGAVLGAYLLGFGEIFLVSFLPDDLTKYRDAFVFGGLILILLLRPQGILGSTEPEKI